MKLRWKLQALNQGFFGAEQISWNRDTLINNSCATYIRQAPQGNIFLFFLQDTLKTSFQMRIFLTHRCTQTRQFFTKSGYFLVKNRRRSPTLLFASCARKLIYFLKRGWYRTNFFFMSMSKCRKTSLSFLKSTASYN